ncbi:TPA: hypothetical protein ACH3X1_000943 [Trebouxia sp. C0004]
MHTAAELDTASHRLSLSGTALETLSLPGSELPAIQAYLQCDGCWHCDRGSSVPSSCRCCSAICQSAEVLVLKSSKGQTWKGLALRQAFMGRDAAQRDGEASVQDAAGGGGLFHGGAEDGGEGRGPSRGWGGAAGEDGDAEEDEDEDDDDKDEDQEDDDQQDDDDIDSSSDASSSCTSHLEGD